jgi:flavin prenyltransferase
MKKIALGIGGSSGSIYANRLMLKLKEKSNIDVAVVMSTNAIVNWELEIGPFSEASIPFKVYNNKDFFAPFASGSAQYDAMVVCPCSMGLLARIAHGYSDDLMTRGADVMLKERKKLIIVPRETPLNLIHLRNMTALTEAGAIICPAMPSFYNKPSTIDDLVDTVVNRIIDLLGIENNSFRWGA